MYWRANVTFGACGATSSGACFALIFVMFGTVIRDLILNKFLLCSCQLQFCDFVFKLKVKIAIFRTLYSNQCINVCVRMKCVFIEKKALITSGNAKSEMQENI